MIAATIKYTYSFKRSYKITIIIKCVKLGINVLYISVIVSLSIYLYSKWKYNIYIPNQVFEDF